MRIRKRQLLSSSSSSSSPLLHLSDPHPVNRLPVVVQLGDHDSALATHTPSKQHASPSSLGDRYQPSDKLIGKLSNGCDDDPFGIGKSGAAQQQHPLEEEEKKVKGEEEISGYSGGGGGEKSNHTSKGDTLVSQLSPSSTTLAQDGKWWEGEKAIPLKKRRGSFENGTMMENNKKMKGKMKTKMNKKCCMQKGEDEEAEVVDVKVMSSSKKKRTKGSAVIMEGSRCSRVNGRGWRCCQQTLVGYSLCEHHLGKGRLRSMTSVRNRSIGTTNAPNKQVVVQVHNNNNNNLDLLSELVSGDSSSSHEKQTTATTSGNNIGVDQHALDNNNNIDQEKKKKKKKPAAVMVTKKRMKLGMVKARSMSSLLGQTNTQVGNVAHEELGDQL